MNALLRDPALEKDCPAPSTPKALLRALVWVVRRLDLSDKRNAKSSGTHASFLRGLFVFDGFSASDVMKLMIMAMCIYGITQWGKFKKELKMEVRRAFIEQRVETVSVDGINKVLGE